MIFHISGIKKAQIVHKGCLRFLNKLRPLYATFD